MIKIKCLECGNEFEDYKSNHRKLCSKKCWSLWRSKNKTGKNSYNWKGGKVKEKCVICGNEFNRDIGSKQKLCSRQCFAEWISKVLRGPQGNAWKGGCGEVECNVCGNKFLSVAARIKKNTVKYCSRSCAAIGRHKTLKRKNTSIEIKMEQELIRRGIVFQKQYPIWQARTIPDFFIAPDICIYCDGDYWHNIPKVKELNFNQNYWLNFYGYKVYRFWEHDINRNISRCVDTIKEKRRVQ